MMENVDSLLYKLRFVLFGVLVVASLFILSLIVTSIDTSSGSTDTPIMGSYDETNAVADGITAAGSFVDDAVKDIGTSLHTGSVAVSKGFSHTGAIIGTGVSFVGQGVASYVAYLTHSAGTTMAFGAHTLSTVAIATLAAPASLVGHVTDATMVSSVIKPADNLETVPVIDPGSPALLVAQQALPAASAATPPQAPQTVAWPLHGAVTTEFGASDWPYQIVHTGIDISDGTRPGTTPVHAFRHGQVVNVIRGGGLGNHVIVDHGTGVTSVYAHLDSIAVSVGQEVDTSTVIGMEGTTGASTGTHLHFEIRVDGQAANPRNFITGQP